MKVVCIVMLRQLKWLNKNTLTCGDDTLNMSIRGVIPESGKLYFNDTGKVVKIEDALINDYTCSFDGSNYQCLKIDKNNKKN